MHLRPMEHSTEEAYLLSTGGVSQLANMERPLAHDDPLDDVFGDADSEASFARRQDFPDSSHPSDMRRLQTEHTTNGYREGVTVAKEKSIQAGFDEGFSLGATVGLAAGQLLGTLEGIAEAVKTQTDEAAAAAAAAVQKLLTEAREELNIDKIFSPEYWAPDGNWSYEVTASQGGQVLFPDVAKSHPLIRKWTLIVDNQAKSLKINQSILEDEGVPRLDAFVDEPLSSSTAAPSASKALDW